MDIYSFGVLLWELVTATPPMRGRLRPIKVCCAAGTADKAAELVVIRAKQSVEYSRVPVGSEHKEWTDVAVNYQSSKLTKLLTYSACCEKQKLRPHITCDALQGIVICKSHSCFCPLGICQTSCLLNCNMTVSSALRSAYAKMCFTQATSLSSQHSLHLEACHAGSTRMSTRNC